VATCCNSWCLVLLRAASSQATIELSLVASDALVQVLAGRCRYCRCCHLRANTAAAGAAAAAVGSLHAPPSCWSDGAARGLLL